MTRARITGDRLRPEPDGEIGESAWVPVASVAGLRRPSLVDIGPTLEETRPATGYADIVPSGGLNPYEASAGAAHLIIRARSGSSPSRVPSR